MCIRDRLNIYHIDLSLTLSGLPIWPDFIKLCSTGSIIGYKAHIAQIMSWRRITESSTTNFRVQNVGLDCYNMVCMVPNIFLFLFLRPLGLNYIQGDHQRIYGRHTPCFELIQKVCIFHQLKMLSHAANFFTILNRYPYNAIRKPVCSIKKNIATRAFSRMATLTK